jgi:FMN phosphatase YigB (HAD superfamily)
MRFRGLIFDIGDVLYDATPWRRWLVERLNRGGVEVSYPELVARWERLLVDVYCGRADYWERFKDLLTSFGVDGVETAGLALEARLMGTKVQLGRRPFDGVEETLAAVKKLGVRLAALSDSESCAAKVRESLESLGLARYFDAVVSSLDIRAPKPAPEAYWAASNALSLPLAHCAFVGHDVDELEGARAVGLFAIAFNYSVEASADEYLGDFRELLALVSGETYL